MSESNRKSHDLFIAVKALMIFVVLCATPAAARDKILYKFSGGNDGGYPLANVIIDHSGNLYGTGSGGGVSGHGVVFKLSPDGHETVLHSFDDYGLPFGGLVMDEAGNLFGTTKNGGARSSGSVFKIASDGTFTVVYSFGSQSGDGVRPEAGLFMDKKGNLFGTTPEGGAHGSGTVFKIALNGTETILHSFLETSNDGRQPYGPLIMDKHRNLYGTTYGGGSAGGWGTVFKLARDGTETILHSFAGGSGDGLQPYCGLVMDDDGNLFGTTSGGGATGSGVVFELAPDGTEIMVHSLVYSLRPKAGLILDKQGNLYGTALNTYPNGNVFKLAADGTETSLYTFKGGEDGNLPVGGLIFDRHGNLYGTTEGGGGMNNAGTVFKIPKKNSER